MRELREITDWEKPIYVKVGATRVFNDVKLVGFRGSPAFTQWRALVGPFFATAPVVEHFSPVTGEET